MPPMTRAGRLRAESSSARIEHDDTFTSANSSESQAETPQDKMAQLEVENARLRARIEAMESEGFGMSGMQQQLGAQHVMIAKLQEQIDRLSIEVKDGQGGARQPSEQTNDPAHDICSREFSGEYRDDDDLLYGEGKAFIMHFEELFKDASDSTKLSRLRKALVGKAEGWLYLQPSETRQDYTLLKEAIIEQFRPRLTPEAARVRYNQLRQRPGMRVTELREKMLTLTRIMGAPGEFTDRRLIDDIIIRLEPWLARKIHTHSTESGLTFAKLVQYAWAYEDEEIRRDGLGQLNEEWQQCGPSRNRENGQGNYSYRGRGAYSRSYNRGQYNREWQGERTNMQSKTENWSNTRTNTFMSRRTRPCRHCGGSHWDYECQMISGMPRRTRPCRHCGGSHWDNECQMISGQAQQAITHRPKYYASNAERTTMNSVGSVSAQVTRPYCTLRMNGVDIVQVLIDSGADSNITGAQQLRKFTEISSEWRRAYLARDMSKRRLHGFDDSSIATFGTIDVAVAVKKGVARVLKFDIAPVCGVGIIVGLPGMKKLEFSLYSPLIGWNVLEDKENRLPEYDDIPRNARTYINRAFIPENSVIIAARRKTVIPPRSEAVIPAMLITPTTKEMSREDRTSLFTIDYIMSDELPKLTEDIRHPEKIILTNHEEVEMVVRRGDTLAYATAVDDTVYKVATKSKVTVNSIEHTDDPDADDEFPMVDCRKRQEKIALIDSLALGEMSMFTQRCRERVRRLFHSFVDVIYYDIYDLAEPCAAEPMRIVTNGGPVYSKPRPVGVYAWEFERKKIAELKAAGFIEEADSNSPWQSPIAIVAKRGTDKYRLCTDFRKLNDITAMSAGRIPQLQELVQACKNKRYFSSFDLKQAYHQMEIAEEDRVKTTFACRQGVYQWTRVPFGLKNAATFFVHQLERMLRPCTQCTDTELIAAYLDDICVASADEDKHVELLHAFLRCCRNNNIKIAPDKMQIGRDHVNYVGHTINGQYYFPMKDRTKPIIEMRPPTNMGELRRFLGKVDFLEKTLPKLRTVAFPLYEITRGGKLVVSKKGTRKRIPTFYWNNKCQQSFDRVKELLASDVMLWHADPNRPFDLFVDGSEVASGSVLTQQKDGMMRVVAYHSKLYSSQETRYSATEREALAILHALRKH